jgi:hypothetical protein
MKSLNTKPELNYPVRAKPKLNHPVGKETVDYYILRPKLHFKMPLQNNCPPKDLF